MADYPLYKSSPDWQFKWILEMLVPEPENTLDKESETDLYLLRADIARWLIDAIEAGILVPTNLSRIEDNKKEHRRIPKLAFEQTAKFRRGDIILWIEEKEIIKTLGDEGHTVPEQTIEMLESLKERGQRENPLEKTETSKQENHGPGAKKKIDWDSVTDKVDLQKLREKYKTLPATRGSMEFWKALGLKKEKWPEATATPEEWSSAVRRSGKYKNGLSAKATETGISNELKSLKGRK